MKKKLLIVFTVLVSAALLQGCGQDPPIPTLGGGEETSVILGRSEDMGNDYIDSFLFLGESTTYHIKSRGVLSGGRNTHQVLHDNSGTAILNDTTSTMPVIYPPTGELMPLPEAVGRIKPRYMLLTFGLNGAVQKIKRGEEHYKGCYIKLIDAIRSASPETKIILGSCFPVAKNMDMSSYSVTQKELNRYIVTINEWTLSVAEAEGLGYLNVNEVLTDGDGDLREDFQNGDGHHLTTEAYLVILEYIRTHGYV